MLFPIYYWVLTFAGFRCRYHSWYIQSFGLSVGYLWWVSPGRYREFLHPRFSCRSFNHPSILVEQHEMPAWRWQNASSQCSACRHPVSSIKGRYPNDSHQMVVPAWFPFGHHGIVMLEWAFGPIFLLQQGIQILLWEDAYVSKTQTRVSETPLLVHY